MLDDYKEEQSVFYNIVTNSIRNKRLSHAYIIDSNGNPDAFSIVISFVKEIICMDIDSDDAKNICDLIDKGNYFDVKVIKPDGMWIKKEQLIDLQEDFSNKSFSGNKKIYIIQSAERMNVQTANSILKFLEEPVDEIIAFLIVDNINLLLPTIISRCQVIKLNKKKDLNNNYLSCFNAYNDEIVSSLDKDKLVLDIINFIDYIEKYKLTTIVYAKRLWHNNFKDRNICTVGIELMVRFYYDVLRYKCGLKTLCFNDYIDNIVFVSNSNNFDVLYNKINYLEDINSSMKFNLNINLMIDKLIIDMSGDCV